MTMLKEDLVKSTHPIIVFDWNVRKGRDMLYAILFFTYFAASMTFIKNDGFNGNLLWIIKITYNLNSHICYMQLGFVVSDVYHIVFVVCSVGLSTIYSSTEFGPGAKILKNQIQIKKGCSVRATLLP